jgi:hypothetical protein
MVLGDVKDGSTRPAPGRFAKSGMIGIMGHRTLCQISSVRRGRKAVTRQPASHVC